MLQVNRFESQLWVSGCKMIKLLPLSLAIACLLCSCASAPKQAQDNSAVTVTVTASASSTATPAVITNANNSCAVNICQENAKIDIATWLTYTHSSGITFRYPSNWQIKNLDSPDGSNRIWVATHLASNSMIAISFDNGPKDINDYYRQDPRFNFGGTEGDAGIRWLSEIKRHGIVGLKYLWGPGITSHPFTTNSLMDTIQLNARLISTTNGDQQFRTTHYVEIVWLITDTDSNDYAAKYGTEQLVKDRFHIFEVFVDNIRFPNE